MIKRLYKDYKNNIRFLSKKIMLNKKQAKVFHFDSFWKRQEKYDKLNNTDFQDVACKS